MPPATTIPTPKEVALLSAIARLERGKPGGWRLTDAYRLAQIDPTNGAHFLDRLIGKRLARKIAPAVYQLTDAAVAYLPQERRGG